MDTSESQGPDGPQELNEASLPSLAGRLAVPTYDRRGVKRSIVHLGVGGFHRAHQAIYLDDLAERRITADWGERGIGLLPADRRMATSLVPQDCLYTVVERSTARDKARIVGSMVGYLFAPDDPARALSLLADPATRIVSLTITEGGYNVDSHTGLFDAENPA